jgi:uncharacterized protein (TIGR02246 family)
MEISIVIQCDAALMAGESAWPSAPANHRAFSQRGIGIAYILRMQRPNIHDTNKLLVLLAISVALVVAAFYWRGNSSEKLPTEYVETQQSEARPVTGLEAQTPKLDKPKSDEAAVDKPDRTAKKLTQAWNEGSSREIASLFADDGTLIIPGGSRIQSRSEIAKTIDEKRNGVLSETTLSTTIEDVSQADPQTAIVKGRYQIDGIKILGFSKTANGTFVFHQRKNERQWLISEAEVRSGED